MDIDKDFKTISNIPLKDFYTPEDIKNFNYENDLNKPGSFPFVRGIYPTMYREKIWTMRQFSGFGTVKETNERYKFLLQQGQTGLSIAFDFPTIMGYDSDHPRAKGEVGKCGVAVSSLADMEDLFEGIPMDKITTSMTINGPAAIMLAFYIVAAKKQGVKPTEIGGTIQNDILKEYIAQNSWIFPPEPSLRLITDIFAYCSKNVPRWNTISISGYHIREAGSTAVQELAFTLANGLTYVEYGVKAGLKVDDFLPRISFFFNSHIDFFEEIAKFRAARRIWAREIKKRYNPQNPRSLMLRFHTQTAGCSLTAQQPENNIIRTAYESLAAVLGGTQSLHSNSMDEVLALPTEHAVQISLRTQQIIANETGVPSTIDPLGGSYFIEYLTNKMEEECYKYFDEIEKRGGVIKCILEGYFQREIAKSSYNFQKDVEAKKRKIVGVNCYITEEKQTIPILKIDPEIERRQCERLAKLRKSRDNLKVKKSLDALQKAAKGTANLMPYIIDAVECYATLGEIIERLKSVFGVYKEYLFI